MPYFSTTYSALRLLAYIAWTVGSLGSALLVAGVVPLEAQTSAAAKGQEIKVPPLPILGAESLIASLDPKSFPKEYQKAAALLAEKKFSAAEAALPSSANGRTKPEMALQRHMLLALSYYGQQNFSEALKSVNQGLAVRGSDSDLLYVKALAQLRLTKPVEAISSLDEAVWFERFKRVSPAELYYTLAAAHSLNDGNVKKVENALAASLSKNPAFIPSRIQLSRVYLVQGNRVAAIKILRDGIPLSPDSKELKLATAHALVTNVDRIMNKDEIALALKATSDLVKATDSKDPLYLEVVPVHIRALLASGKPLEAQKALQKALKANPNETQFIALQKQVAIETQASKKSLSPPLQPVS